MKEQFLLAKEVVAGQCEFVFLHGHDVAVDGVDEIVVKDVEVN